jgi:hypothetical protein
MVTVSRRAALALLVVLACALPATAQDPEPTTYVPPFAEGPTAGDDFNLSYADGTEGRLLLGRAYPVFNPISCAPGGGAATFEITHPVSGAFDRITAAFTEAAVDSYVFVTLSARTADGQWLASTRQRGPLVMSGELTAPLLRELPEDTEAIVIRFGLEVASACPHVNGGTVRFTSVTVS